MALKASWPAAPGSESHEIAKSWNCPGRICPPDQVTSETAVLKVPSSVVTGLGNLIVFTVAVQPGTGRTSSWAIGCVVGICTSILTVFALASSFGTWKVSSVVDPAGTESGVTVTCAKAGAAKSSTPAAEMAPIIVARRKLREIKRDILRSETERNKEWGT